MLYKYKYKNMVSKKSYMRIFSEASIVGICLILLVMIIQNFAKYIPDLFNDNKFIEILFISGFLFHILFEYTGLNLWYAKDYCSL